MRLYIYRQALKGISSIKSRNSCVHLFLLLCVYSVRDLLYCPTVKSSPSEQKSGFFFFFFFFFFLIIIIIIIIFFFGGGGGGGGRVICTTWLLVNLTKIFLQYEKYEQRGGRGINPLTGVANIAH